MHEGDSHQLLEMDKLRRSTRVRRPPERHLRRVIHVKRFDQCDYRDNFNPVVYFPARLTSEMESTTFKCKVCGAVVFKDSITCTYEAMSSDKEHSNFYAVTGNRTRKSLCITDRS